MVRPFVFFCIWPFLLVRDSCCCITWDSLRPIAEPIIIYTAHVISYSVFVVLLLIDALKLDRIEAILDGLLLVIFIFVFGLILQEIRSFLRLERRFYFSGLDYKMDISMLVLFVLFFILRAIAYFTTDNLVLLRGSCYFLGPATVLACVRVLRYLSWHPVIGPVQRAISKIVEEILLFLVILMVFLTAFAAGITNVYRGTRFVFNETVRANATNCPAADFSGYVLTHLCVSICPLPTRLLVSVCACAYFLHTYVLF